MATINLTTKFLPYTDEQFSTESKLSMLTNKDFDWTGAHSIKVYKIGTSAMNDYDRSGANVETNWSRFGPVASLDATTEELTLKKDRSFTFVIDKLDTDETAQQLQAATALARQNRQVTIPEIDAYVYNVMATAAGTKPGAVALTTDNIYTEILKASEALDDAEAPEDGRVLVVTPATYALMKKSPDIVLETDIGQQMRIKGVLAMLDGAAVVKVPKNRLPENFGFMLAHPVACVAPVKLEDYRVHQDPPGISGALVEGRVCYDAFTLENKVKAIYYQATTPAAMAAAQTAAQTVKK